MSFWTRRLTDRKTHFGNRDGKSETLDGTTAGFRRKRFKVLIALHDSLPIDHTSVLYCIRFRPSSLPPSLPLSSQEANLLAPNLLKLSLLQFQNDYLHNAISRLRCNDEKYIYTVRFSCYSLGRWCVQILVCRESSTTAILQYWCSKCSFERSKDDYAPFLIFLFHDAVHVICCQDAKLESRNFFFK